MAAVHFDAQMPKIRLGTTLIVIGALVLLATLFTALSFVWDDDSNTVTKAAVAATSPAITTNDVQIDGWIDDRRVTPGDPITFWIVVQNPPLGKEIRNVEIVALRRPNFEIPASERRCWRTVTSAAGIPAETVPICRNTAIPVAPWLPQPSVVPAGSVTVEGHLIAGPRGGKFGVTAVVGWVDASGAHRRKPISVAPVIVESQWRNRVVSAARILQSILSILKDFALPVVLLWLGYRIKKIETAREETLKKIETARESTRKKTDDHVARVQQTWTLMLPKLHQNAEKYYIPLISYAGSVRKHHTSNPEYSFFFYNMFLAQMKRMVDEISGFYLKDMIGEDVVSLIWEALLDEADSPQWFGRVQRENLQLVVTPTHTYFEFQKTALLDAAVASAHVKFVAQSKEFAKQLPLFELFSTALWFETNICYVVWYDKPPEFPRDAFKAATDKFEAAFGPLTEKHSSLVKLLRQYGESVEARTSPLL